MTMSRSKRTKRNKTPRSSALRVALLVPRTLGHDGRPEPHAQIVGQLVELRIAVNFDGFPSRIADDVAVVAPRQVIVQFGPGPGVQGAIEVIGQFVEKLRAL